MSGAQLFDSGRPTCDRIALISISSCLVAARISEACLGSACQCVGILGDDLIFDLPVVRDSIRTATA